jgi:hypothetical protein
MLTPFCLTVALIMAAVMSARDAHAQDFLNQEWILDPTLSYRLHADGKGQLPFRNPPVLGR